jgi:hypothetical protein
LIKFFFGYLKKKTLFGTSEKKIYGQTLSFPGLRPMS